MAFDDLDIRSPGSEIALARAGLGAGLGSRVNFKGDNGGLAGLASSFSWFNSQASATPLSPSAPEARK